MEHCTTSCVEKVVELIVEQKNKILELKDEIRKRDERIAKAIEVYRKNQRTIEQLRKQNHDLHLKYIALLDNGIDFTSDDDFNI